MFECYSTTTLLLTEWERTKQTKNRCQHWQPIQSILFQHTKFQTPRMTINMNKSYIQFSDKNKFWLNFLKTTSVKYQENQTCVLTRKYQGNCILCLGHFSPPFLAMWFPHLFWQLMDFLLNWFSSLTQLRTILIAADRWQVNGLKKRTYEEWVCKVSSRNVQSTGHSPPTRTAAKLLHYLNISGFHCHTWHLVWRS